MSHSFAYEDIRRLIEGSPRTLKDIATHAMVSYDTLQRWTSGRQPTLTVEVAEKVYHELTGGLFTR